MAVLPAATPVTLDEAKAHLRITHDFEDPEISGYLLAAIEYIEVRAQRIYMDRALSYVLADSPGTNSPLCFDLSPVVSVDTIAYYDEDNASQSLTLTNYVLYADEAGIAQYVPPIDTEWPGTAERPHAVTVTYTAGYGGASSVPQRAKQAILLMTQHGYDQRSPVVIGMVSKNLELAVGALVNSLKPGNYPNP